MNRREFLQTAIIATGGLVAYRVTRHPVARALAMTEPPKRTGVFTIPFGIGGEPPKPPRRVYLPMVKRER